MEKGEVAGRATQNWAGWKSQKPDWIQQNKINLLAQGGTKRNAELANVPLLRDFAKNEEDRQLIDLFLAPDEIARSILVGPDVPADRVQILRKAFESSLSDPSFVAEAEKMRLDVSSMSGEEVSKVVGRILDAPTAVKERARGFLTSN
jgi:hypothetical protein